MKKPSAQRILIIKLSGEAGLHANGPAMTVIHVFIPCYFSVVVAGCFDALPHGTLVSFWSIKHVFPCMEMKGCFCMTLLNSMRRYCAGSKQRVLSAFQQHVCSSVMRQATTAFPTLLLGCTSRKISVMTSLLVQAQGIACLILNCAFIACRPSCLLSQSLLVKQNKGRSKPCLRNCQRQDASFYNCRQTRLQVQEREGCNREEQVTSFLPSCPMKSVRKLDVQKTM